VRAQFLTPHISRLIDLFPPKGEASLSNSDFVSLIERQANFVASLGTCTATIDRILTALVASAPQKRLPIQTRALGTALEIALALVTGTRSVTSPHQLGGGCVVTATHPLSCAGEPKEGWDDVSQEGDRARMDARVFTGGQLFVFMTGSANFGPGTAINSLAKTTVTDRLSFSFFLY
jgi:hypothetical protein